MASPDAGGGRQQRPPGAPREAARIRRTAMKWRSPQSGLAGRRGAPKGERRPATREREAKPRRRRRARWPGGVRVPGPQSRTCTMRSSPNGRDAERPGVACCAAGAASEVERVLALGEVLCATSSGVRDMAWLPWQPGHVPRPMRAPLAHARRSRPGAAACARDQCASRRRVPRPEPRLRAAGQ